MKKPKTKRVTTTVRFDVLRKLQKMAKEQNRPMSSIIIDIIKNSLDSIDNAMHN